MEKHYISLIVSTEEFCKYKTLFGSSLPHKGMVTSHNLTSSNLNRKEKCQNKC